MSWEIDTLSAKPWKVQAMEEIERLSTMLHNRYTPGFLEAENKRLLSEGALKDAVIEAAKDFLRASEKYESTDHTAFLWEQGELIKALERMQECECK